MILYWLDVETTGLDPSYDHLLEIAIVATRFEPGLPAIGAPAYGIFRYPEELRLNSIEPEVLSMHAANGLWRDSENADPNWKVWSEIGDTIASWDDEVSGHDAMLAGRSVHFDRTWLTVRAPQHVVRSLKLSHRHFDLTSIKRFTELCGWQEADDYESEHRALPDVLDDINLARNLIGAFAVENWKR